MDNKTVKTIIEMIEKEINEENLRSAYNKSRIRIAYLNEIIDKIKLLK